jgi:hypothetical protein
MLEKLGPEGEEPLVYEDTGAFSPAMTDRLRSEMTDEYQLVLQHLRHAFVFEDQSCPVSSSLELTAMRHMKHLSHFAEELAEGGHELEFVHPQIDMSQSVDSALQSDLALTHEARERFVELSKNEELAGHQGLKIEVEHMISQEEFLASTVEGLLEETQDTPVEPEPELIEGSTEQPDAETADGFTVGSLMEK